MKTAMKQSCICLDNRKKSRAQSRVDFTARQHASGLSPVVFISRLTTIGDDHETHLFGAAILGSHAMECAVRPEDKSAEKERLVLIVVFL